MSGPVRRFRLRHRIHAIGRRHARQNNNSQSDVRRRCRREREKELNGPRSAIETSLIIITSKKARTERHDGAPISYHPRSRFARASFPGRYLPSEE